MSHLNEHDLHRMSNMINGMKIQHGTKLKQPCEACMAGKFTASASKEPMRRENQKLRKIHSDTWIAPRNQPSQGGAKGFQSYIDDMSRYSELKLFKSGDQILRFTDEFLKKKTIENNDICSVVEM